MEEKSNPYIIPVSILIAGVLIAGAIVFNGSGAANSERVTLGNPTDTEVQPGENIKPVSEEDHILGNPEAPVKIVEFSDLECPFCKQFHFTLQSIMEEYGRDGRVAWVYRHFPLEQLHSKAPLEAQASECVAELGGNSAFWIFIDKVFEVTPANNGLDLALLPEFAEEAGVDRGAFQQCLDSGRTASTVSAQLEDAVAAGGTGTPFSIVIGVDGTKYPVSGALPLAQVKSIIEQALGN